MEVLVKPLGGQRPSWWTQLRTLGTQAPVTALERPTCGHNANVRLDGDLDTSHREAKDGMISQTRRQT